MKINKQDVFCMVIDIQEKLFLHIHEKENLLKNCVILLKGLKALNIEIILNEQYKKGLGETMIEIKNILSSDLHFEKTTFSSLENKEIFNHVKALDKKYAIICGTETHVCVMQTCLDLIANKITPIIITNCVSSRNKYDHNIALKRLHKEGAILATYESILFELLVDSKNTSFKQISKLVK